MFSLAATRVISRSARLLRVLPLIADSHAVAFVDEARDAPVRVIAGDGEYGYVRALFLIERDPQLAAGESGVFEKERVEIAQADQQEGIRYLPFQGVVLPGQRGCSVLWHLRYPLAEGYTP
jgi:hypothetical protein